MVGVGLWIMGGLCSAQVEPAVGDGQWRRVCRFQKFGHSLSSVKIP